MGEWVLKVGKAEAPTLIKYAGCNAYLMKTTEMMSLQAEKVSPVHGSDFTLVDYDADGEEKILAAILFRFSPEASYEACQSHVRAIG